MSGLLVTVVFPFRVKVCGFNDHEHVSHEHVLHVHEAESRAGFHEHDSHVRARVLISFSVATSNDVQVRDASLDSN